MEMVSFGRLALRTTLYPLVASPRCCPARLETREKDDDIMSRMMNRGGQGGQVIIPGGPLGKARYALASGRPDEAERLCRKRLERDPGDTSTRVVLAQALLQMQQVDGAIDESRRAIREQSTNADAHMVLASALLQRTGRTPFSKVAPEAETAARRAVQLQPKAARTHVQLAEVLAAKQDFFNARLEADEAIRLEPRLAGAHLMRALVLLSDHDPNGAVQASDAALRNDRTLTQAELIKANAFLDLQRYDDALTSLDVIERQSPALGGANTLMMRGRVYFKQRKYRRSYATFLALQRKNPRLKLFAPIIAGVNTLFVGQFGQSGQYAWLTLLLLLVALVFFLLHLIPVVGGWVVAVLLVGVIGFLSFSALRQARGTLLPAAPTARAMAIGGTSVAFAAVLVLALFVIASLSTNVFHSVRHWQLDPPTLLLGGVIAIGASVGALYLLLRYGGETGPTAA